MKLSFFDTLDAVLRSGSLAGAAREMHVTPSAVSMQMKQMEAHFGQPLFDRAGLTVRPTPLARHVALVHPRIPPGRGRMTGAAQAGSARTFPRCSRTATSRCSSSPSLSPTE